MFLLNLKVPAWFLIEQSRSVHRQLQPGQDKRLSRENERRRCRVPLAFSVICRLSVSDPLVELEGRLPLPPLPPLPRAACSRHLLGLRGARKAELREDAVRPCPARAERLRLELFARASRAPQQKAQERRQQCEQHERRPVLQNRKKTQSERAREREKEAERAAAGQGQSPDSKRQDGMGGSMLPEASDACDAAPAVLQTSHAVSSPASG